MSAQPPEVLTNEDGGVLWVSATHSRGDAARAVTRWLDDFIAEDEPIHPEDLKRVGMRPATDEDKDRWGWEIVDIECPLDDPAKRAEFWRWAE